MFSWEISYNEACVYLLRKGKTLMQMGERSYKTLSNLSQMKLSLNSPCTGFNTFSFIHSVITSLLYIAALTVWMFLLSLQRVIGILTFHILEDGVVFLQSDYAFPFETPWYYFFQTGSPCYHHMEMPFINIALQCTVSLQSRSPPHVWEYS